MRWANCLLRPLQDLTKKKGAGLKREGLRYMRWANCPLRRLQDLTKKKHINNIFPKLTNSILQIYQLNW